MPAGQRPMRMIAGYLERAINFEKMAAAENDATLESRPVTIQSETPPMAVTLVTFVLSVRTKRVAVLVPWFEVQKRCGRLRRRTKIQQGWGTSAGQA